MSWKTLSWHFKQQYEGAYRYLDRCGEFMVAAVDTMNFLPGDVKPSGAKLEIPENGLTATVDTLELVVKQDMPEDSEIFLNTCVGLADLVTDLFQPKQVTQNGFAGRFYWPIPDVESLLAASLMFGNDFQSELGKKLGLVPAHKRLDFNFTSGSLDLHVVLYPITFENVSINRQNPKFKAPKTLKNRAERLNKSAERLDVPLSHALLLEVDLVEYDPPQNSLKQHFQQMHDYADLLVKEFAIK